MPTSILLWKTKENFRKMFTASLTMLNDCVDYKKKLWKILKEMGIPDHLTCLLKNLYTGQEATIRTRYGKMNLFKIWKGVYQGCIWSLFLVKLIYRVYHAKCQTGWSSN